MYYVYFHRRGLPLFQRVASLMFLLQCAVSLIAIVVFCIAQSAGGDVRLFQLSSIAQAFADVYPIDPNDAFAKTRFDNLFLPLVLIYAASLPCLGVSILRNLPSILGDLRRNWQVLAPLAFFLFGLWLELFVPGHTVHKDLQQTILDGRVVGYVVLFVILPLAFAICAAALPLPRRPVAPSVVRKMENSDADHS
ncbi:hypothetical protein [Bradyrhizobium sp. SK17]|uniref:hypothetical protein n=1 Tax=Bradyrhizobium sp. SK17 TaxID=2057741 RepID=UPI0012FE50EF|nr:hypothetical protein [Bradyrhizobium sp. SK17]